MKITTQQINERIAKLLGWVNTANNDWIKDGQYYRKIPPTYTESLDACRDFESRFAAIEQTEYAVQLRYIVTRNVERDHEPLNPDTLRIPDGRYYCAKSHERCEAFLRMKGQWE